MSERNELPSIENQTLAAEGEKDQQVPAAKTGIKNLKVLARTGIKAGGIIFFHR
jgi:hypothetical protein